MRVIKEHLQNIPRRNVNLAVILGNQTGGVPLEERDIVARDLFGEPVTESPRPGGGKARLPYKSSSRPSEAATEPDPSRFTLPLPALLSVDGSIESNPFRQYGKRARVLEGTFEPFSFKQLKGFRFRSTSGETFIIVPRKTLTVVDGEPILLVADAETPEAIRDALTRGRGIWLSPKPAKPAAVPVEQSGDLCRRILETWRGKFTFREGHRETETTPAVPGLRKPQVGALHAALAHITSSVEPATIVMPTGTGKTETMLAIYAHERFERLMVVVPTDALRDQVAGKFETMGILQQQECLPADAEYPVVLRLKHIPKSPEDVEEMFARANVIVTTMSIAGKAKAEVQERMAQMCGALFIDEAHHVKAKTWRAFRAWFSEAATDKLIFQFTATPFREDGGKVDGKFIYYYPLAKAQNEDYFGQIAFRAVSDLEGNEADDEIMRLVGETLDRDIAEGRSHLARSVARRLREQRTFIPSMPLRCHVTIRSSSIANRAKQNAARISLLSASLRAGLSCASICSARVSIFPN
ncbi:hypothetical protein ABID21_002247 [Pseudorhizobium tarimense]|uniref:Helicase ATP-binding domain-containing protein n=1 Tax=Pseudorhizobium tarimense TaxID=1079109 RepID=A0ABV2H6H6_9HYPH